MNLQLLIHPDPYVNLDLRIHPDPCVNLELLILSNPCVNLELLIQPDPCHIIDCIYLMVRHPSHVTFMWADFLVGLRMVFHYLA
jgi:hypothetical protein